MPGFAALCERMKELSNLDAILGLLSWDEETYAPPGGRASRGGHSATLEGIKHNKLTDPALGALIEAHLEDEVLTQEQRTMVARLKRTRDLAVKVPEHLVKALAEARSASVDAWAKARAEDDFSRFAPHLEVVLDLTRARAEALGSASGDPYDALLDEFEPNATLATLRPVFAELRAALVPLLQDIVQSSQQPDVTFLQQSFEGPAQWDFTMTLLKDLGFDFENGRQDKSTHPFTGSVGPRDVRLTTRIEEKNPFNAIFSSIHECGHGLYEQGFNPEHFGTPLAGAPSMGIHESQSRLWENQVGRSRAFWQAYLPVLKTHFPKQLEAVDLDTFHRAVNHVRPSLIRTESDEVTYNLHILLRFELEQALLSKDLSVKDLPGAWRERMKADLGVEVPTDREGCLQDIHWAFGAIGYFPTYTLGNLFSAQLMQAYESAHPEVWKDIEDKRFAPLLQWLRTHIHRRGYTGYAAEIVQEVVGAPLSVTPFMNYLKGRFGPLYGLAD